LAASRAAPGPGRRQGTTVQPTEKSASDGASIVLTIDKQIQHIAERELEGGVKSSGPKEAPSL
jgi:cell division protein FtsI/penicillin-binding protein 2